MYICTDLHLLSYSHVQYSLGQGIGQGRGDVKDCVIQGLEDFPHMEQSYKNWERAEQRIRKARGQERDGTRPEDRADLHISHGHRLRQPKMLCVGTSPRIILFPVIHFGLTTIS